MSKYTPGPWEVESYLEPYNRHLLTYQVRSEFFVVAKCGTGFETKENARLIAAAPDLLDALEYILVNLERSPTTGIYEIHEDILEYAITTVAKAKGENAGGD